MATSRHHTTIILCCTLARSHHARKPFIQLTLVGTPTYTLEGIILVIIDGQEMAQVELAHCQVGYDRYGMLCKLKQLVRPTWKPKQSWIINLALMMIAQKSAFSFACNNDSIHGVQACSNANTITNTHHAQGSTWMLIITFLMRNLCVCVSFYVSLHVVRLCIVEHVYVFFTCTKVWFLMRPFSPWLRVQRICLHKVSYATILTMVEGFVLAEMGGRDLGCSICKNLNPIKNVKSDDCQM